MTADHPGDDPVLSRRARIGRLAETGQRLGYGLLGLAIVAFVVGAVAGFRSAVVTVVVGALVAGSAVLLPAIVAGYGVKAADRDDRRGGR